MTISKLTIAGILSVASMAVYANAQATHDHAAMAAKGANTVTADVALTGVPMHMSPDQLPDQFTTQLRDDVSKSTGTAVLKQKGNDIEYTFAWENLTGPVTQAHFHYGPHDAVGARAYSICGVASESPACPTGTSASITGVWKNADIAAVKSGGVVIAFHTDKYPAPVGELAVYIPAARSTVAAVAPTSAPIPAR